MCVGVPDIKMGWLLSTQGMDEASARALAHALLAYRSNGTPNTREQGPTSTDPVQQPEDPSNPARGAAGNWGAVVNRRFEAACSSERKPRAWIKFFKAKKHGAQDRRFLINTSHQARYFGVFVFDAETYGVEFRNTNKENATCLGVFYVKHTDSIHFLTNPHPASVELLTTSDDRVTLYDTEVSSQQFAWTTDLPSNVHDELQLKPEYKHYSMSLIFKAKKRGEVPKLNFKVLTDGTESLVWYGAFNKCFGLLYINEEQHGRLRRILGESDPNVAEPLEIEIMDTNTHLTVELVVVKDTQYVHNLQEVLPAVGTSQGQDDVADTGVGVEAVGGVETVPEVLGPTRHQDDAISALAHEDGTPNRDFLRKLCEHNPGLSECQGDAKATKGDSLSVHTPKDASNFFKNLCENNAMLPECLGDAPTTDAVPEGATHVPEDGPPLCSDNPELCPNPDGHSASADHPTSRKEEAAVSQSARLNEQSSDGPGGVHVPRNIRRAADKLLKLIENHTRYPVADTETSQPEPGPPCDTFSNDETLCRQQRIRCKFESGQCLDVTAHNDAFFENAEGALH